MQTGIQNDYYELAREEPMDGKWDYLLNRVYEGTSSITHQSQYSLTRSFGLHRVPDVAVEIVVAGQQETTTL